MEEKIYLKKISCSNCGAELIFDPGTQMVNCNFCGSKFEIENAVDEEVIVPDSILPFKITKEMYYQALLSWLSQGDYTPDDILTSSIFEQINGLYLPMYIYEGRYHGNWSASSGYNREVDYTEWDEYQKKMVKKTKTITDWRPSSGQFSGTFKTMVYAGHYKGIKSEIIDFAQSGSINSNSLKDYDLKYLLNFNFIEFTLNENSVWKSTGIHKAYAIAYKDLIHRIPGDCFKDLSEDTSYNLKSSVNVYVPYWIVYYKYAEKEFYVCMDGTNSSRIDGKKPVDEKTKSEAGKYDWIISAWSLVAIAWIIWGFVRVSLLNIEDFIVEKQIPGFEKPDNLFYSPWLGIYWWIRFGIVTLGFVITSLISNNHRNKIINSSKQKRESVLKNILTVNTNK